MHPEWWHWIIGGLALTLAELLIPAFFIIWFGLAALLVGLLLLVLPELSATVQISLWIVVSIAMVVLWFRVFRTDREKTYSGSADGEALGAIGILVDAVPAFGKGRVRFQRPLLGSDEWTCLANEEIAAGARVKVVSVEGNYLTITPL